MPENENTAVVAQTATTEVTTQVDDNFDFDNIDAFLGIPSASVVITPDSAEKKGFMSSNKVDTTFIDNELKGDPTLMDNPDTAATIVSSIVDEGVVKNIEDVDDEDEIDASSKGVGRSKLVKDAMIEATKNLVDRGILLPFVDAEGKLEKPLDKYTQKDYEELIEMNLQQKVSAAAQQAPIEMFQQFPENVQAIIKHTLDGAKEGDLKNLFKQLANAQDVFELNTEDEEGQIRIIREFENLKGILKPEEIEEEILLLKDRGDLKKISERYKPKVDEQQALKIQKSLDDQAKAKQNIIKAQQAFTNNVYDSLNRADLNGIPLTNKVQTMLYQGLTDITRYQDSKGNPTNSLGHLLEQYQFGEKQDLSVVAEVLWLLSDPAAYRGSIKEIAKKEAAVQTQLALRTEQASRTATSAPDDTAANGTRQLKKGVNRNSGGFFKRG